MGAREAPASDRAGAQPDRDPVEVAQAQPGLAEQVLDPREAALERVLAPAGGDEEARAVVERRGEPVERRVQGKDLHRLGAGGRRTRTVRGLSPEPSIATSIESGGRRPPARSGHSISAMRSGANASSSARSGSSAAGSWIR